MKSLLTISPDVIYLLIGCPLFLISCSKVIELDTPNSEGRISIFGQLTDSPLYSQPVQIMITSGDIRRPIKPFPSAEVSVIEADATVHNYQFDETSERYIPVTPFHGVPGQTYQLIVEAQGQRYESTPQTIPNYNARDSSYLRFIEQTVISSAGASVTQFQAQVFTNTKLPEEEEVYLKWEVEQVYVQTELILPKHVFPFSGPRNCYIIESVLTDNLLLFDGSGNEAREIPEANLFNMQLDQTLDTAGGFGIIQYSITKEAVEYWKKIDQVANRVGSIFEVPPAPVKGNLTNPDDPSQEVLGFFEVSKVDSTGVFITPEDLPVFVGLSGFLLECNYEQSYLDDVPFQCFSCLTDWLGVPEACFNCTTIPNSTLNRPTYLKN